MSNTNVLNATILATVGTAKTTVNGVRSVSMATPPLTTKGKTIN